MTGSMVIEGGGDFPDEPGDPSRTSTAKAGRTYAVERFVLLAATVAATVVGVGVPAAVVVARRGRADVRAAVVGRGGRPAAVRAEDGTRNS